MQMRPIVDELQAEFEGRVSVVYLNAFDRDQGEAAFAVLSLPGHPGSVIFNADGEEIFRRVGIVDEGDLRQVIEGLLTG